jgi:hypothetical protein
LCCCFHPPPPLLFLFSSPYFPLRNTKKNDNNKQRGKPVWTVLLKGFSPRFCCKSFRWRFGLAFAKKRRNFQCDYVATGGRSSCLSPRRAMPRGRWAVDTRMYL